MKSYAKNTTGTNNRQ